MQSDLESSIWFFSFGVECKLVLNYVCASKSAWLGLISVLVSNAIYVPVSVYTIGTFLAACSMLCLKAVVMYVEMFGHLKSKTNQGSGVRCGRVDIVCRH